MYVTSYIFKDVYNTNILFTYVHIISIESNHNPHPGLFEGPNLEAPFNPELAIPMTFYFHPFFSNASCMVSLEVQVVWKCSENMWNLPGCQKLMGRMTGSSVMQLLSIHTVF